jgi:hypothetical protein
MEAEKVTGDTETRYYKKGVNGEETLIDPKVVAEYLTLQQILKKLKRGRARSAEYRPDRNGSFGKCKSIPASYYDKEVQ